MTTYYDSGKEVYRSIPDAPYYVLSNDSFMSGWGCAKNKTNTCVVPCKSMDQAMAVERYIESRGDQKYIRVVYNKPRSKHHVIYSLLTEWLNN